MIDFRLGRYQDVLQDVVCDAVITDPPYSERVHKGHDYAVRPGRTLDSPRSALSYDMWAEDDVNEFVIFWKERCKGWLVCLSDSEFCTVWRNAFDNNGYTAFHPVPALIPGMTVRLAGDGPSSWAIYANVARPKSFYKWGTLPGGYYGKPDRGGHIGGKPLWLMNAIIRDYSKPGDLICDPCAGGATTLIAAASQGRRAVGSEMDEETYKKAKQRIEAGYTPDMYAV